MKNKILLILKSLIVIIVTILTFGLASKMIGDVGNMPQSLIDTYGESIFIAKGAKLPAIIGLCLLIMVFLHKYLGVLFFSFSVFGTNWLLYTSFYNIFLDIPLWDVLLRCFSSSTGVYIGLAAYENKFGIDRIHCLYDDNSRSSRII